MRVFLTQPVEILRALFCVTWSLCRLVLHVSGSQAECAYVVSGRMNCLYT